MHTYIHTYIYICIYYVCVCAYKTYEYVHLYLCNSVSMYVCMYMCVCVHVCMSVCMYAHASVRMCLCVYACMYVCMYVVCVYACTYVYVCIRTYRQLTFARPRLCEKAAQSATRTCSSSSVHNSYTTHVANRFTLSQLSHCQTKSPGAVQHCKWGIKYVCRFGV